MSLSRQLARVAGAACALAAVAIAGPASAHVTVNPNSAEQGGYAELSFRVPNESDKALTTKLQVYFPADQPIASVSIKPHPGWSYQVKTVKLDQPIKSDDGSITQAVSQITWTADSQQTALAPGEFDDFDVSAGPLPDSDSMMFKALQTYSDGSVVRWIEPTTAGGSEPEHPAPVLTLVPASSTQDSGMSSDSGTASDSSGSTADSDDSDSQGTTALVLSIIALVVAGGAGALTLARKRS